MNIESIRSRMSDIKKFIKIAGTKTRYKSLTLAESVAKYSKRAGNTTGKVAVQLSAKVKNKTMSGLSRIFQVGQKSKEILIANKKRITVGTAGVCVVFVCGLFVFNAMTAYQYSYDGKVLGVVDEVQSVYEGIARAEENLSNEVGTQVVIDEDEDIEVKRVIKDTSDVDAEEDVVNALTSLDQIKIVTYGIIINDGEEEILVDSKEAAEEVLEAVKAEALGDDEEEDFLEINFEESVKIAESKTLLDDVSTVDDAIDTILTGGIEEKVHIVKKGDSLADIAEEYDVSRKDIKKWNPEIEEDNVVYVNQEIQLQEQKPLINVVTKKNVTFDEKFGPEIKYDDTDDLYEDEEIITKEGKSGKRTVNADIIERNGELVERIDHSYTVQEDQVTSKIMRGTRERPDKIGKGHYDNPMEGKFTSPFGKRWGRMHNGIDISAPVGTDVHAADSGVVVSAGPQDNGYGVVVEISHGDGRTTFYAHNSSVLVKAGDLVYRGQHIAESGNTGRSTGPHLHFETRFDGVAQDPMKYL